jgi:hypothetical protein
MSKKSQRLAGILLIVMPTVVFGGVSILRLLISDPAYAENTLRQDLWRAGHAHAGVLLIFSLIALRYVDEAALSDRWKAVARNTFPLAAILMPTAFFFSVLTPDATEPNIIINLAFVGAALLMIGMLTLGIGLLRVK